VLYNYMDVIESDFPTVVKLNAGLLRLVESI